MQPVNLIPGLPDDIAHDCLIRVPYHVISSGASVCTSWKCLMKLQEFWQHRKVSGYSRNVVVMAQSRIESSSPLGDRLTLYEPETGYWTELPPLHGLPMFCQLIGIGSNLVVIGGRHPVSRGIINDVFIYNFVSATWRRGTSMPGCGRLLFACASDSNGKVFVAGGHDGKYGQYQLAMTYDVAEDRWDSLPDLPRMFSHSKGVFSHGKFHVIGGCGYQPGSRGVYRTSIISFDVATWQWCRTPKDIFDNLLSFRNCTSDGDGKLFMSRGECVEQLQGSKWQVVAKLPDGLGKILCMIAWPGKVLVIGKNLHDLTGESYKCFLLDLKNSQWKIISRKGESFGHVQSGCCIEL